jgi:hypothetical protein
MASTRSDEENSPLPQDPARWGSSRIQKVGRLPSESPRQLAATEGEIGYLIYPISAWDSAARGLGQ